MSPYNFLPLSVSRLFAPIARMCHDATAVYILAPFSNRLITLLIARIAHSCLCSFVFVAGTTFRFKPSSVPVRVLVGRTILTTIIFAFENPELSQGVRFACSVFSPRAHSLCTPQAHRPTAVLSVKGTRSVILHQQCDSQFIAAELSQGVLCV